MVGLPEVLVGLSPRSGIRLTSDDQEARQRLEIMEWWQARKDKLQWDPRLRRFREG